MEKLCLSPYQAIMTKLASWMPLHSALRQSFLAFPAMLHNLAPDVTIRFEAHPSTLPCLLTRFISQLEGSAVMLPQHAPYTDPVQILICGGSSLDANDALDNCVSIAPEAQNPTWMLERSVSPARNST
jgi:hypothetical protein